MMQRKVLYPYYLNLVLEPVSAAAPGILLETQTLSIQPKPPESESAYFNKIPQVIHSDIKI